MARRVSLQVWLFAILGFAAFGTVYTIVYLQHLESISEEHGFRHYRRARDFGRRRDRSSSSFSSSKARPPPPSFAEGSDLKSSNAADWLHDRNARNAEAAAGTRNRSIGGVSGGGGIGPLGSAEHVKLDAGGFHKRQRHQAKARRADSRGGARSGHGGGASGSTGSTGRKNRDAHQEPGGAPVPSADQHVGGSGDGSGGSHAGGSGGSRTGTHSRGGGVTSSVGIGSSSGERHAGYAEQGSGGGSSRGRPQGRRGDPARCGRGVPRGQENRFCCEGLFACGGGSSGSRNSGDTTSAAAASELQRAASGPQEAAGEAAAGSGKAVIDCARVNDNFADCADGSDEPGTSAASHLGVRFTCHDGATTPTSFVDDGICDCCDGSDERSPRERCRNTCAAKVDEDLAYI